MKGLLIKDLRLLKAQKTFLMTVGGFAIIFSVMNKYSPFLMPYITMMVAMFAVGTINYDEHNNGGAYLFALPVSRKGYVLEKYGYCLLLDVITLMISIVISGITIVIHGETVKGSEFGLLILSTFLISVIIYAWMIPIQLKFSAERSRMALTGIVLIAFICGYGMVSVGKKLGIEVDIDGFFEMLMRQKTMVLVSVALIAGAVMLLISYVISLKIMERKEY